MLNEVGFPEGGYWADHRQTQPLLHNSGDAFDLHAQRRSTIYLPPLPCVITFRKRRREGVALAMIPIARKKYMKSQDLESVTVIPFCPLKSLHLPVRKSSVVRVVVILHLYFSAENT